MQQIDIYSHRLLITIPILICAYILWRRMIKTNRIQIKEFFIHRPIHKINSRYLRKLMKKLRREYSDYCLINVSNEEEFYLVNDEYLIEYIQHECAKSNGLFESQLSQPYLVLNSECNEKLTAYDFDAYILPQFNHFFSHHKTYYIDNIIKNEFEIFSKKLIKKFETTKTIDSKYIYELVFNISDSLLKRLFCNLIYDDETNGSNTISNNLMNNLYQMLERFTLGLFVKQANVNEYSKLYMEFLKLIDSKYQINATNDANTARVKFLIIKSVYLDTIKIFSCLLWIISDAFKLDANQLTTEIIKKYLIKISTLDVYYLANPDELHNLPSDFNFMNKSTLIVLNLYSINTNNQLKGIKSNDFILTTLEHLTILILKRFKIIKTEFFKSNDLGLINFNEIKHFEVE